MTIFEFVRRRTMNALAKTKRYDVRAFRKERAGGEICTPAREWPFIEAPVTVAIKPDG